MGIEDKLGGNSHRKLSTAKTLVGLAGALFANYDSPTPCYAEPNRAQRAQIRKLEKSLKENPRNFDARIQLGDVYLAADEKTQAAQQYNRAESVRPRNYDGHIKLGGAFFKIDDYSKSEKEVDSALQINPNGTLALTARSSIHIVRQQYSDALAFAKQAIQETPYALGAISNHGISKYHLSKSDGKTPNNESQARKGIIGLYTVLLIQQANNNSNAVNTQGELAILKEDAQQRYPALFEDIETIDKAISKNSFPKKGFPRDVWRAVYRLTGEFNDANHFLAAANNYQLLAKVGHEKWRSRKVAETLAKQAREDHQKQQRKTPSQSKK